MSHSTQSELQQKTQQLLDGPLKHIRGAALAAALLPLASVAAAPASAQDVCQSAGTVCGFVFTDTNGNGLQDAGETGLEGAKVFLIIGADTIQVDTGPDGFYYFSVPDGTYPIGVQIPVGMQPSPADVGGNDTIDSDGVADTFGFSVTTVTVTGGNNPDTDFGFFTTAVQNPGTGTPGYWKNLARQGRQGQDDYDVQLDRAGEAERADRQRRELRRQHHCRGRRLDVHVRAGGQQRAGLELRVVGRRAAAQADGRLQQRPALRSASAVERRARWPVQGPPGLPCSHQPRATQSAHLPSST
jgi:hypothetical protein